MAKGKKKDKKAKKGKKGKNKTKSKTIAESENDEPDPNIKCSQGEFTFLNEDVYIGEFCAHRQGLIWREGYGVYKTKDGQEYEGRWHNDNLLEGSPVEIRYPHGHVYVGLLAGDKYHGPGTYYCSDVAISCNFDNNKPNGEIMLIDPKGEVYVGKARATSATLLPENVLFDNINPSRGILYDPTNMADVVDAESGITCLFSETVIKDEEQLKVQENVSWEDVIFAKSMKTDTQMDFDKSDWYKDWLRFKNTKQRIKSGIKSNEEHLDDAQWLEQYELYKRLRRQKSSKAKHDADKNDLFSIFHSAAYRNSCPAVRVVYPSSNLGILKSTTDYTEQREIFNQPGSGSGIIKPSLSFHEKTVEVNSVTRNPSKPKSRDKCLNKKNYGCGTNSLMALVENFFDNKPICSSSKYKRTKL